MFDHMTMFSGIAGGFALMGLSFWFGLEDKPWMSGVTCILAVGSFTLGAFN